MKNRYLENGAQKKVQMHPVHFDRGKYLSSSLILDSWDLVHKQKANIIPHRTHKAWVCNHTIILRTAVYEYIILLHCGVRDINSTTSLFHEDCQQLILSVGLSTLKDFLLIDKL